jgi:hypothetical protein
MWWTRFEADELPSEAEFVASLDSGRKSGKVPVLEASEESLAKFAASGQRPAARGCGAQNADLARRLSAAGVVQPLTLFSPLREPEHRIP